MLTPTLVCVITRLREWVKYTRLSFKSEELVPPFPLDVVSNGEIDIDEVNF